MLRQESRRELAASIERTLQQEACRNELTIAFVRVATLAVITPQQWYSYAYPQRMSLAHWQLSTPLLCTGWFAFSVVLAIVLRRGWYRPWLRYMLPLSDGLLVFIIYGDMRRTLGAEIFLRLSSLTNVGITCALIAATGPLRLTRASAVLAACTAVLVFSTLSLVTVPWSMEVSRGVTLLAANGLLGIWMTAVVRRAMVSEVGRAMLGRFLPDHVIDDAYHDPIALLSEPRTADATILVSDLRGFTAASENLPPARVLEFLNEVQGAFAAAVRRNGGVVDKFMGDGLLAVFGAPDPLPDHASRALAAAASMWAELEEINVRRRTRDEPILRLGIGIHSGPVVTGCLGSASRLEFTVIGDTVNTASRLESLTKEKGIDVIVSEESVRRTTVAAIAAALGPGSFLDPIGQADIRGRKEPLKLHAVVSRSLKAATPGA